MLSHLMRIHAPSPTLFVSLVSEIAAEGVFSDVWLRGPASAEAIRAALREFGKIEECGWARRMLAALETADRPNS